MADTLYRFRSEGVGDVISAFQRIGDAADKAGHKVSAAMSGASGRAGSSGGGAGGRPSNYTEKLGARVARDQERAAKRRMRLADREAAQQAQRNRRNADREIRELERKLQREAKAELRAKREMAKASARIEKERAKETERIESSHRQKLERDMNARHQRSADLLKRRRDRGSRIGAAISGFAINAAMVGGAATVGVLGAAGRQRMSNRDHAIRLGIIGGGNADDILKNAEQTALAVPGATTSGVLGATEAFSAKTGDVKAGQQFQRTFAEIAVAASVPLEEIGSAAADLFEKFDIKSIEDMEEALSVLVKQGKDGAFELKDAASQYPRLAAAAERFGFKGKSGLATLGGLTQIARTAVGSPEEAATSLENMFSEMIAKSGKIKSNTNTDIFTDKTKRNTRNIKDILPEIISGTKGNQEKISDVFGIRSMRAISPLFSLFNKTIEEEKKAAEARGETVKETELLAKAEQAVRDRIEQATTATGAYAEVQRDLAVAQSQSSVQLTAAWDAVVSELGSQVTPMLVELGKSLGGSAFLGSIKLAGDSLREFSDTMKAAMSTLENIPGIGDKIREWRQGAEDRALGATPEERVAALQKRIRDRGERRSKVVGSIDFANMSADESAQLVSMSNEDKRDIAMLDKYAGELNRIRDLGGQALSVDDFVSQYVSASGADTEADRQGGGYQRRLAEEEARSIARRVTGGKGATWSGADPVFSNPETDALIQALGDTVARNKTRTDGIVEGAMPTDQAVVSLGEFAAALAAKAAEVKGIKFDSGSASAFQD